MWATTPLTEAVGVHEVGGWGGICEYKKCYTCSFTTDCLFKTHMQSGFAFIMGVKVSLEGNYEESSEYHKPDGNLQKLEHNIHQKYAVIFAVSLSSSLSVLNWRTMATLFPRETQLTGTAVI